MIDAEVPAGINAGPVTAWFEEHIDGVAAPLRFERVAGGHSCLTYVVIDDADRRYVLRRPPLGHVLATAHDVAREHKIISARRVLSVVRPKYCAWDQLSSDATGEA